MFSSIQSINKESCFIHPFNLDEILLICTIDGYAMPLVCRGGLMYLSLIGKPTDAERGPQPYTYQNPWMGSFWLGLHPPIWPPWSNDPDERFAFDPNFDEFGDYTQRAIQTLSILDDSSLSLTPCSSIRPNQHVIRSDQHVVNNYTPDFEQFRLYFGWVNVDTVQKTMEQSTQWGDSIPNTFPMKSTLSLGIQPLTFLGNMSLMLLILSFLTHLQ